MADAPMTDPNDREPPRLRGIEIVRLQCGGRRSEWFEGVQTALDRTVAVKRLLPRFAASGLDGDFIEAGRRAAEIVHPSALSVYNVFPDRHCVVMEWCSGQTLRGARGSLSALEALRVGVGVLDGLAGLHATGRRHGNLVPGNIFLVPDGGVRINDFFHAAIDAGGRPLFPEDARYVAPELLAGEAGDWRSDLFGLGVILGEALDPEAGKEPLSAVVRAMSNPSPGARGPSPAEVLRAFKTALRREEDRLGGAVQRPQRQYRRIPAELSVRVKPRSATPTETAAVLSKIRDIGENGVFVAAADPMGVGSIVELNFELQGGLGNIHAFGVVRWRSDPPLTPGMGVQFVEVDEDGVEKLRNYMRRRRTDRMER